MNHVLLKSTKIIIVLICLLLGFTPLTFAQGNQVRGKVMDESGESIIGATVMQKGTTNGTATDVNGDFTLNVPGNATLVITYLGYISKEVRVNNQTNLIIQLSEDTQALDEVVVTGYTTQKKVNLTGSISTLGTKELTVTKNENVVNALAGKIPGVRITQRTAEPGTYSTLIDVRGYGTPLFVIDGIPRDLDYFARMDPEEIETVTLLKDASAAIYGMRAANGVMLISTKRGTNQNGKVDISFSTAFMIQQMLYVPNTVSTIQWMELRNEQRMRSQGYHLVRNDWRFTDEDFKAREGIPDTDWVDAVFRNNTPQQQHNLTIRGGSENLRYFISTGYSKQEGAFRSGSIWADRWNFRTNMDANITKGLTTSVQLGTILTTREQPNSGLWNVFKTVWLTRPDGTLYANNNPLYLNGDGEYINEATNPLATTNSNYVGYINAKSRMLNGTMTLRYQIPKIDGLAARASFDYSMSIPDETQFKNYYYLYVYDKANDEYIASMRNGPNRSITRSTDFNQSTDLQLALEYSKKFDLHNVGGVLVYEEQYQEWEGFWASRNLSINTPYLYAGDGADQVGNGSSPGDHTQKGLIGQFSYDYASKYLLDLRFRYDGSSRWPKESRWGFFPSASVGWRISEEGFFKRNIEFISNLKIRASYGQVGDDDRGGMQHNYPPIYTGYEIDGANSAWYYSPNSLINGMRPTTLPNPSLTWYKVEKMNAAVDFGLFNQKLSGSLDVYRRNRHGLLGTRSVQIPETTGASLPQENLNADSSFGWEIELVYHNNIGELNYLVSGQFSAARSMRTSWLESLGNNSFHYWQTGTSGRYTQIWRTRKAIDMFTSMDQIRSFTEYPVSQNMLPGQWYFQDWNGDGIIDNDDQYPLGTRDLALFNFGFNMAASYKNFDLGVYFQGAWRTNMQLDEVYVDTNAFGGWGALMDYFYDRWHPVDRNADYWDPNTQWVSGYFPMTGLGDRNTGTNQVKDASYIRLKTLEIGYNLPTKLLSRALIKNLRLFVSGYNLLTFTGLNGIDPERPGSTISAGYLENLQSWENQYAYPNNRSFTFGASIKF